MKDQKKSQKKKTPTGCYENILDDMREYENQNIILPDDDMHIYYPEKKPKGIF